MKGDAGMKKIPLRFWASLAGFSALVVCMLLDWVEITGSRTALQLQFSPEKGEMSTLIGFISRPESPVLQNVLLIFISLLVLALVFIIISILLQVFCIVDENKLGADKSGAGKLIKNTKNTEKLQQILLITGFSITAVIPLAFIIYTMSINDPSLLRPSLIPVIQIAVSLAAMCLAIDKVRHAVKKDWQLYILLLPAFAMVFIFVYLPMYGIQVAFRDFKAAFGIAGSEWVGMTNFTDFFASYYSTRLLVNTFLLNVYGLLWAFPIPIIMALLLNQLPWRRYRRFTQTIIYSPHFISPVVMVGIIFLLLSPTSGLVNRLIEWSGGTPIAFMLESSWFRTIFIATDVWQHAGWNTILYIAALTAIDPSLYEAAEIDGANKLQKIRHIDIPHMMPIIIMLFILNCGAMLSSNTDKALLMQTTANIPTSDIIGVYVYRMGIVGGMYSYTAAINLLINVINFFLIISVNWIARRSKQASLF